MNFGGAGDWDTPKPSVGLLSRPCEVTRRRTPARLCGETVSSEFRTPTGRWFAVHFDQDATGSRDWTVEFSEIPEHVLWIRGMGPMPGGPTVAKNIVGTRRPTGRGEAVPVYATVLAEIAAFLEAERPDRLDVKGATGLQTRLYKAMARRHAAELGRLGYRMSRASLVPA